MTDVEDFVTWLQSELDSRGLSRVEAARLGHISASMFDKVINRFNRPGIKFCRGVARAFNIPQEEVLRRAGLLNPTWQQLADTDASIGEIVEVVKKLPAAEREELLNFALYRLGISKSADAGERREAKAKRQRREEPDGP